MTTVHESYQFLIRKYVDQEENIMAGHFIDPGKLSRRNSRRSSRTVEDPEEDDAAKK